MERDEAMTFMLKSLKILLHKDGSDLFITAGFPPAIKIKGTMTPISQQPLSSNDAQSLTQCIMNDKQLKEFEETQECNFAISPANLCRFRVNAYVQQGCQGLVLRVIPAEIPNFDKLNLPPILKDIISHKNGLIIMVGGTGSGKSTSMAAMIDHRNENSHGHIITIEDPIEFVHKHKNCIMMQREVGVDTKGWEIALHNTLRQAPDVIVLGEIRDAEIMNFGMEFAQTGHLAMATLHANNANQAVDRILGFFPIESQEKLRQDIALNLRAIISQRLVKTVDGGRCAAIEILINTPLISDLIAKGDISGIKPIMAKSRELGMQTFDQALLDLYQSGKIGYDDALKNADSRNELRLQIKLAGREDKQSGGLSLQATDDDDDNSVLVSHD
jgi:twitching motility protein PilU